MRDGSYRCDAIADTRRGRVLPPSLPAAIYRFIFVVRIRAFPLRFAGCLQSNENLPGGQIFFRRHSALPARAVRISPSCSSFSFARLSPRRSISSGAYLYTSAPRYLAQEPVRACVRACVTARAQGYRALVSGAGGGIGRKINNCRKEFIGLSCAPSAWKTLARRRYFLIISLARGSDVDSRREIIRFARCVSGNNCAADRYRSINSK